MIFISSEDVMESKVKCSVKAESMYVPSPAATHVTSASILTEATSIQGWLAWKFAFRYGCVFVFLLPCCQVALKNLGGLSSH